MRIVIDARESGTSSGRYADKLIEHLHLLKPDYEIVVLTKSHRIDFFKAIAPKFKVIKSDFKEFTFAEQLGLWRQLRSLKADLVHYCMTQQPIFYRGRAVTMIHDLTAIRFNNPAKNPLIFKIKQLIYRRVIKIAARKSTLVLTGSEFTRHDIANFTGIQESKIRLTYEAADKITEAAEKIPVLAGKKFILYVGRPTPHKNLNRLVDAFKVLKQSHPQLKLVLAGKTDFNYKRLKEYTIKKSVGDVMFTGFIPDSKLRWLYENAQAYVFPSLSEGFGLPGLESMCYGLPVISSNATCLPEIYKDAALYFNPLDVRDIADKINTVLNNPDLADKLSKAGEKLVSQYSWQDTAKETLSVFDEILKSDKNT